MNKVFKFYRDSTGHGYLAVKVRLLQELNLLSSVSALSRVKGQTVYLEGGLDLSNFKLTYEAKYGSLVTTNIEHSERSWVKNMQKYSSLRNVVLNSENPNTVTNENVSEE